MATGGVARTFAFALIAMSLSLAVACGGSAPEPAAAQPAVPRHATAQVGDVTVRANAIATSSLDAAIAERYGIAREPDTVLLLVGVRRGAEETPMAAEVAVTVTDLRGQRRDVAMRELHGNAPSGEPVLDYFGVVGASPPDTLRFDIEVEWTGGRGATLRVEHELRPE